MGRQHQVVSDKREFYDKKKLTTNGERQIYDTWINAKNAFSQYGDEMADGDERLIQSLMKCGSVFFRASTINYGSSHLVKLSYTSKNR